MEMQDLPRSISPYRRMIVSDITGNLTRVADSVVLEMDDSSSSRSNSSDSQLEDEEDEEGGGEGDGDGGIAEELHCDDWEIRMLAAEMDRREHHKKNDEAAAAAAAAIAATTSSSNIGQRSESDENGILLRRRRKRSDTDTECSELETDLLTRPRAASLDQHQQNIRRTAAATVASSKPRGVFKAMSFDRDKDRL